MQVAIRPLDDRRREPLGRLVHDQERRGSSSSARPIASICCSPPESCVAAVPLALGEAREELVDAVARPARLPRVPRGSSAGARRSRATGRAAGPAGRSRCPRRAILYEGLPSSSLPAEADRAARRGGIDAHDRVAERRLAHAVAADHGDGLGAHRERRRPRAPARAVEGVEALDLEQQRGSLAPRGTGCRGRCRARVSFARISAGVPSTTLRPSCIIVTYPATVSATSMSCSIRISVTSRGEREQELGEPLALAAGEPGRRLVEHHQSRLGDARHPDLELALLAVREVDATSVSSLVAERDLVRRAARALADARRRRGRGTHRSRPPSRADEGEVDVVLAPSGPAKEPRLLVACGRARARAAPARAACVTSCPSPRSCPTIGGKSPAIEVEQRRLAGPVRAEDRAALAVRDVEVDVAHGLDAAEAPADPPQAEDRLGVVRLVACVRSPSYLMTWFVMTPFLTTLILPCHGQLLLHARRLRAAGRRARLLEEAAERLVDVRHVADDGRPDRVALLDDLQRVLILDRLPVRVELDDAAVGDLVARLERAAAAPSGAPRRAGRRTSVRPWTSAHAAL